MELSMMKQQLKNVYFVSSGKFGVSVEKYVRLIADKHGLVFFDQTDFLLDRLSEGVRGGSDIDLETIIPESYTQSTFSYSEELALNELIRISQDRFVIANVDFTEDLLSCISDYSRVALICPTAAKRLAVTHRTFEAILAMDVIANNPTKRERFMASSERRLKQMTETVEGFMKSGLQCVVYDIAHTESEIIEKIEKCFGL